MPLVGGHGASCMEPLGARPKQSLVKPNLRLLPLVGDASHGTGVAVRPGVPTVGFGGSSTARGWGKSRDVGTSREWCDGEVALPVVLQTGSSPSQGWRDHSHLVPLSWQDIPTLSELAPAPVRGPAPSTRAAMCWRNWPGRNQTQQRRCSAPECQCRCEGWTQVLGQLDLGSPASALPPWPRGLCRTAWHRMLAYHHGEELLFYPEGGN